ncbi:unnamed protein product (macronuclear) [Paramecium tetraurelia]|uniref:Uncharacterized protein n=1 Tax=Paramecium tetraurelia TaxID=5888 RepID=A0DQ45_PARTE|nr:uncharacterized protein GSPATT00002562001 [Paramecium tetraurelia]CAK85162.1 unnamed protein product [Paramecium tetraurelia]|eukprot:XP_001452559.1 hypothetical protein (macronuclear) [Paramecium tetraurelia strain d4-2]
MSDSDIKLKIKEVIEATILSIVQEQSEKIERLEKLVEQQQERIQLLESKLFGSELQKTVRKDNKHHTTNPIFHTSQQNQIQAQKPDATIIKTQLKKLEQEREKTQDHKQLSQSKPKFQQQNSQQNITSSAIQRNNQIKHQEAIKALPDPKKLKTQVLESQKQFSNTQPIKLNNQPKSHSSSSRELIGLKKSPSQSLSLVNEQQVKTASSPKNCQKSQFQSQKQDAISPQNSLNNAEDNQSENQQSIQASPIKEQHQVSLQHLDESDAYSQYQESQTQQLENNQEIQEQEEEIVLPIEFKTMTIDSFEIIEMNFVSDLLQQEEIPESVKQVIFVFLVIVEDFNAYEIEDQHFWDKASKFLQDNEKQFPLFLQTTKEKAFKKSHLNSISQLINKNPDVIDPDKFEDIDALTCTLAYFIKDFHSALKKLQV